MKWNRSSEGVLDMALCDAHLYQYVTDRYFDRLNTLSPISRAAEIFRLETESLSVELLEDDEFFGRLFFVSDPPYPVRCFSDSVISQEAAVLINAPMAHGSRTVVDKAHTIADYRYLLENGLSAYRERIEHELTAAPGNEMLLAMRTSLTAVEALAERMRAAATENKNSCPRAGEIAEALRQVPFSPARSFREAVQAVWLVHFLLPVAEHAYYSISFGRVDQYLYPYYERSLAEGMTRDEAKRILFQLYALLNDYTDAACLLNIGPKYNALSELIIECQRELALPAPILGARIAESTPDSALDLLVDETLFTRGQPTFYGEESCVRALLEKGVPEKQALCFSNSSCMGISLAGEEYDSMWGCVLSVSAILEAAVNRGRLLSKEVTVPGIGEVTDLDSLYTAFRGAAEHLFAICAASYEARADLVERYDPDPFLSLLTEDCIARRCDRISGARYHNATVECMGMINAADGIAAIDTLVFKKKRYTISEMTEAVRGNFKDAARLRAEIAACPKYGQSPEGDAYAVKVAEILQEVIRRHRRGNLFYCPSLHTLTANVQYGAEWGAGYDGRPAGAPFAKNAGPSDEVRRKDPTSLILSAAGLPQHKFFGGQPIDLNFSADMIRNHKQKIVVLIRTYLKKGGLQLQVNSLSAKLMRAAVRDPEGHRDLIVRRGGYSVYFNDLSEAQKQSFIRRTEIEEGNV